METLANEFNTEYVQSIEKLCSMPTEKQPNQIRICDSLFLPEMTENDLIEIVGQIKTNKAVGYDQIRARDIKFHIHIIKPVLIQLYNCIFSSGIIPEKLKTAIVRPIYKKGEKNKLLNYRPVCILSVVNYIMEKYINKILRSFISKHNILTDTQYGFREKMGTSDLLEDFFDYVYENLDCTKYVLAVFIDFTRAFETINHSILLDRLYSIGIRGKVHDLIQNYLLDRYQIVRLGSKYSRTIRVKQGIPQGAVLGPLLFNLYINEIAQVKLTSKLSQFADDTVIV